MSNMAQVEEENDSADKMVEVEVKTDAVQPVASIQSAPLNDAVKTMVADAAKEAAVKEDEEEDYEYEYEYE